MADCVDIVQENVEKSQEASEPQVQEVEGGYRGWATVLGAFLAQCCGYGYTTSFGVYQDYYTRIYITNQTPSTISWIGSVNAFLVISTGLIGGRMYDRGYFRFLLYGGSFLTSLSLFMLSLAKPDQFYLILLCQGFGLGLGAGMIYIPTVAIVSHYFPPKRAGLAMCVVVSGASLGATVHPLMLNNMLNLHPRLGFANTIRASAGLVSGLLLIACALMRPRLPPKRTVERGELRGQLIGFVRDRAYVFATLGFTFFAVGFYFPVFYLQLAATSHGLDETFAFYALVILSVSSFAGRILCGISTWHFGIAPLVVVSTGFCAVLIFSMIGVGSVASVVAVGTLYGLFSGAFVALMGPLMALLTQDPNELGMRMGISFALSGVGDLTGTPIAGALLTSRYLWWRPAVFSGVMALVGTLCFAMMGVVRKNRQGPM